MAKLSTIAILNQRKGVGKTTTTLSLGMKLAEQGFRVLLVDLDPQASLSAVCGVSESEKGTLASVFGGSLPGKVGLQDILRDILPEHCCYLAPADLALAQSELGLIFRIGREHVLKAALDTISMEYDVALLDCPPSLGMMTLNALNAADTVLIPVRPELNHLRGICLLGTVIERVKREINPYLSILGVVVTYYNHTLSHHRKAVRAIKAAGLPLLPVGIEESKAVSENGSPDVDPAISVSGDSQAMNHLADYVSKWINRHESKKYGIERKSEIDFDTIDKDKSK